RAIARAATARPPPNRGSPLPPREAAGSRARNGGWASGAGRAAEAAPPRLRRSGLPLRPDQHVAAEALPVRKIEAAGRVGVVPDLHRRGVERRGPVLDLVRRPVLDVDAAHIGAPPGTNALEVLFGVAHAPEELDQGLVLRGVRGRVAPPPEVLPALSLLLWREGAQIVDLLGPRDVGEHLEDAVGLTALGRTRRLHPAPAL